jgi:hypothetical protein
MNPDKKDSMDTAGESYEMVKGEAGARRTQAESLGLRYAFLPGFCAHGRSHQNEPGLTSFAPK